MCQPLSALVLDLRVLQGSSTDSAASIDEAGTVAS